jgi:hypothetical protein
MCKAISNLFSIFMSALFLGVGIGLFGKTYGALFDIAPVWFTTAAPVAYPLSIVVACVLYLRRRDKPPYLAFEFAISILAMLLTPFLVGFSILASEGGPLNGWGLQASCALLMAGAALPPCAAFFSGRYTVATPADSASAH